MIIDYVGTRWYKCDFHLHTKASKCFRDETYTPETFIKTVIDHGLECIAITDHNTGRGIDEVKIAAQGTGIIIFPGVEVTCTDAKIHILILFDVDKTTQDVEDFLLQKMNLERSKFGEVDAHVDKTVSAVLSAVEEYGAIAIPAHIDEYNGLSLVANTIKKEIFLSGLVHAVQIVHEELVETGISKERISELVEIFKNRYNDPSIDEDKIREWSKCAQYIANIARLTFSDNPNSEKSQKHGLWGIGKQYSWLKMTKSPNLESLRQSLLVPALRVKNIFDSVTCPYEAPSSWIKKVSFSNTAISKTGQVFEIAFSPQLNTIIGGRGSGKSSIIRFIRGALKKNIDINDIRSVGQEFNDFYQRCDRRTKNGVLTEDTEVVIDLYNNNLLYRITSKNIFNVDRQEIMIEQFDEKKNKYHPISNSDYLSLIDVKILSQKQIYEIARSPNALINIIDDSIPEIVGLKELKNQVHAEYLAKASERRSLEEKLESKVRVQNEVAEIEARIKALNESGITDLLSNNQTFSSEKNEIDRYIRECKDKSNEFDLLMENIRKMTINENVLLTNQSDTVRTLLKEYQENIGKLLIELSKMKNFYIEKIELFKSKIDESEWNISRISNLELIETKKKELGEQAVKSIESFQKLVSEREEKEVKLKEYFKLEDDITAIDKILKSKFDDLLECSQKISQQRKDFLKEILKGQNVEIRVNKFSDKVGYEQDFRQIIQKDHEYTEPIQHLIGICFAGNVVDGLKRVHGDLEELRNEKVPNGYDGFFKNCISKLSPEQYDRLLLLIPGDEIFAQYRINKKDKFKPISNASAGQKTATILTFILSYGKSPLILDQPEDDLDNHLVYDLIVERLQDSKNQRQIIVVTHNANIPVNGDAEYIIAMDSEKPVLNILHQGTIDEAEIKKEICAVMEGGEDAFKLRSRRYELIGIS